MSAGDTMDGRRYPDLAHQVYTDWHERMEPGGYRRVELHVGEWTWECTTPNGLQGTLSQHEVTEHEDGTITASPSILVSTPGQPDQSWHGYLERGIWREV